MQKYIIEYSNKSFEVEAANQQDYIKKVKAKFFEIYLETGVDWSKSAIAFAV